MIPVWAQASPNDIMKVEDRRLTSPHPRARAEPSSRLQLKVDEEHAMTFERMERSASRVEAKLEAVKSRQMKSPALDKHEAVFMHVLWVAPRRETGLR